jgi:hypothetical protein
VRTGWGVFTGIGGNRRGSCNRNRRDNKGELSKEEVRTGWGVVTGIGENRRGSCLRKR